MNSIDQELIMAAFENNVPEVSRLLSIGADVNAKDSWHDKTPLHWASASYKGNGAAVQALLARGANIGAKDDEGDTPLHAASCNGHLPIVKALVSGGADILAVNNDGRLPIHCAVRYGNSAVSKYLLQHYFATTRLLPLHELVKDLTWIGDPNIITGRDPNIITGGDPPLCVALNQNVLDTDDVVEIIEYLVDRDPTLHDEDGSLPLHVACRRGVSFPIVQSLVNLYKASVKSVTPQGDLPLFLACNSPEPSLDTIFMLMKLYPDLVYSTTATNTRSFLFNRCGGNRIWTTEKSQEN
jgi:ankyrin repeat protein